MSILIIATGLSLMGILIGLITTATAPVGYEDETGFHFGNENGQDVPSRAQSREPHLSAPAGMSAKPA